MPKPKAYKRKTTTMPRDTTRKPKRPGSPRPAVNSNTRRLLEAMGYGGPSGYGTSNGASKPKK